MRGNLFHVLLRGNKRIICQIQQKPKVAQGGGGCGWGLSTKYGKVWSDEASLQLGRLVKKCFVGETSYLEGHSGLNRQPG